MRSIKIINKKFAMVQAPETFNTICRCSFFQTLSNNLGLISLCNLFYYANKQMVHPKKIPTPEVGGNKRFFNTKILLICDSDQFLEK